MTFHRISKHIVVRHSSKAGKADSIIVKGERSVDVLHEAVTEEPDGVAETEVLAHDRTVAQTATCTGLPKVEAGKRMT